jgi:hypothetical protein
VIVCADHSPAPVEQRIDLRGAFAEWEVAGESGVAVEDAELALCPNQRAAMVYALVEDARAAVVPRVVARAREIPGVDVIAYRDDEQGVIESPARGTLRFAPGDEVRDARGNGWAVTGDLAAVDGRVSAGELRTPAYPDALRRVWAALTCATSGDVLLSAAPGYEFPDWGGAAHLGGGSHGSLHHSDSLGALVFCGLDGSAGPAPGQWSITDVAPMVRAHFGAA